MHWNWHYISLNPNITWNIIQANPDIQWDWLNISQNLNISLHIILSNPDKPWNWNNISKNPNLFKINISKVVREYFAQKTILKYWRNAICNPEYKICKKRLQKEFDELC
jgi:hypothetical protein